MTHAARGCPLAAEPAAYGKENAVYRPPSRGVWPRRRAYRPPRTDPPGTWDSTIVRPSKKRGGFRLPIHNLAEQQGRPLHLRVTGGPVSRGGLPGRTRRGPA